MKTFALAIVALFASVSAASAQQTLPNFKNTRNCVNLGMSNLTVTVKTDLAKKGVVAPTGFVDNDGDCRGIAPPYIRWSVSTREMQSSTETTSTSGNVPGLSSSGSSSRSGPWMVADAMATLVIANGSYQRVGFNSEAFQAGNYSNSGSMSTSSASSSSSFSATTPEDQATADAMSHAIHDLIYGRKHWIPGAAELIAQTFKPVAPIVAATTAPPQTEAEKIRAKTADLQAQIQSAKDEIRAHEDEKKAEKERQKAEKELAKVKAAAGKKKK